MYTRRGIEAAAWETVFLSLSILTLASSHIPRRRRFHRQSMDESLPSKKPSESAEASSSERAICLPHRPKQSSDEFSEPNAVLARDVGRGHIYEGVHISGQSIVQMGDHITVQNFPSSPHGEDGESERHQKLLGALRFERMDLRRETIEQAHAETCQWVFDTKQYLSWQDSTQRHLHHGFFWIKGKPGSGKSTMMKCILERQQSATPSRTVLSFLFQRTRWTTGANSPRLLPVLAIPAPATGP